MKHSPFDIFTNEYEDWFKENEIINFLEIGNFVIVDIF